MLKLIVKCSKLFIIDIGSYKERKNNFVALRFILRENGGLMLIVIINMFIFVKMELPFCFLWNFKYFWVISCLLFCRFLLIRFIFNMLCAQFFSFHIE